MMFTTAVRRCVFAVLLAMSTHASADDATIDAVYQKHETWAGSMAATRRAVLSTGVRSPAPALVEQLCRRFWEDFPETDWFMQDAMPSDDPMAEFDVRRDCGWYFQPKRDAAGETALIERVLAELAESSKSKTFAKRFERLLTANVSPDEPDWLTLYMEACRQRRAERLESFVQRVPRFVFTKHYTLGGSHYAYTEGQSDAQAERHFVAGAALCLAEWDGGRFRVETLIEDPTGTIRDPDVSHDAARVLFAWKKSALEDDYHLYELDLADRSIRPLTEGLGVADYEGIYLPDGDILFNSTRCVQTVDCFWTEVSNLYRCDRDGRFLRRLTFDQVHDNYPTITQDGRILYTRWEYNDRGQVYPQPLLQMNPDGTNQTEFYGVNSWFPTTILHARGIPGTQRVLAIATGHHSRQTGKLIVIDPARGRQENAGVQLIAPVRETPAVKVDSYGQKGELFQYPYPLDEREFLVTYHPIGWDWRDGEWRGGAMGPRFGLYWMDEDGRRERLVDDPRLPCSQSVPLRTRPIDHLRPSLVDYRKHEGTCYVQDVHAGGGIEGVARGTVKTLRVVTMEFRAAGIGSNGNRGPGGGALISTPIAVGNGAWDPKRILGDATVHADGSAFFRVPARTPVYFQLLDADGQLVQSMRSWATLQPGENASCVGCHEHKNSAPLSRPPLTVALAKGAETLLPFSDSPTGFRFVTQIQPILDRHCVACHDGRDDVPYDLTPTWVDDRAAKRRWYRSYLELTHAEPDRADGTDRFRGDADHPLVNWISTQSAPPMLPAYSAGSAVSGLITLLNEGHEKVKLSPLEHASLCAWIDLGVPFCGDYIEANLWSEAESALYQRYFTKRERLAAEDRVNIEQWLELGK